MPDPIDLLNNNDTTLVGFLLASIVILISFLIALWRTYQALLKYTREQDKETLILFSKVTGTVRDVYAQGKESDNKINEVNDIAKNILRIIKERLKIE